tara:strand:- start:3724 stop:4554 length:831 start_codon:yes stop_codon:yes gene_type:complete
MKILKFFWRRIFIWLQKTIPFNQDSKILKVVDKFAVIYHDLYENKNYDLHSNGEEYLINKLYDSKQLSCVFDVGANKGQYSLLVRRVSESARILAFEPVKDTYTVLNSNVRNMGIDTYNFAFGNIKGPSYINLYSEDTLSSMVNFQGDFLNKKVKNVQINVNTGNSFLKENNNIEEISLLKIDTEGYENKVLEGFKDYFPIINVIQFEYGMANLSSKYFLYDYFKEYSNIFKIGKLYPRGVIFFENYNINLENFIGPNFVMVKKEKVDLIKILNHK